MNRADAVVWQPDPKVVLRHVNVMHSYAEIILQDIRSKKFTGAPNPYSVVVASQAS